MTDLPTQPHEHREAGRSSVLVLLSVALTRPEDEVTRDPVHVADLVARYVLDTVRPWAAFPAEPLLGAAQALERVALELRELTARSVGCHSDPHLPPWPSGRPDFLLHPVRGHRRQHLLMAQRRSTTTTGAERVK